LDNSRKPLAFLVELFYR